jgi:hypothetical protein
MKVFFAIDFDDELKKMSGVGILAKKVYCCVEHIEKYKKFKKLKLNLKKIISEDKCSNSKEIKSLLVESIFNP